MELLRVVYHQYRWPFLAVMALTMTSAGLGIGIIAFINQYPDGRRRRCVGRTPMFLALLALLMAVTLGSQLALTTLGHYFCLPPARAVSEAHPDTDIERLEQLGSASLLASLSSDVRNITVALRALARTGARGDFNLGRRPIWGGYRRNVGGDGGVGRRHRWWAAAAWSRGFIAIWPVCASRKSVSIIITNR